MATNLDPVGGQHVDPERELAFKRLKARRDFQGHLATYLVVNAFLVFLWWTSGVGYFWPGLVMAGWGIGLVLNFWEVYLRRPITEGDLEKEMRQHPVG